MKIQKIYGHLSVLEKEYAKLKKDLWVWEQGWPKIIK